MMRCLFSQIFLAITHRFRAAYRQVTRRRTAISSSLNCTTLKDDTLKVQCRITLVLDIPCLHPKVVERFANIMWRMLPRLRSYDVATTLARIPSRWDDSILSSWRLPIGTGRHWRIIHSSDPSESVDGPSNYKTLSIARSPECRYVCRLVVSLSDLSPRRVPNRYLQHHDRTVGLTKLRQYVTQTCQYGAAVRVLAVPVTKVHLVTHSSRHS